MPKILNCLFLSLAACGICEAAEIKKAAPPSKEIITKTTLIASKDTTVRADLSARMNDNYGSQSTILVGGNRGGWVDNDAIRALIQFNLKKIRGAVTKATLQLDVVYVNESWGETKFNIDAHKILQGPWNEGNGSEEEPAVKPGALWVDAAEGVAWQGADEGGDDNNQTAPMFDHRVECTIAIAGAQLAPGNTVSCDITELAKSWQQNPDTNFGIVLRDNSLAEFAAISFAAREIVYNKTTAGTLKAPRLVVESKRK